MGRPVYKTNFKRFNSHHKSADKENLGISDHEVLEINCGIFPKTNETISESSTSFNVVLDHDILQIPEAKRIYVYRIRTNCECIVEYFLKLI